MNPFSHVKVCIPFISLTLVLKNLNPEGVRFVFLGYFLQRILTPKSFGELRIYFYPYDGVKSFESTHIESFGAYL